MKKLLAVVLSLVFVLSLTACGEQPTESGTNENEESAFTSLVTIDDVEIHEEVVNGQPCFWITNNSEYTLVGVVYVKAGDISSGEYVSAYASKDFYAPGESSEVVPFYKTNSDSKSAAIPNEDSVIATAEEVAKASSWSIEFSYKNDIAMENFEYVDGSVYEWVQYSFVSDSYKGFSYVETHAKLEEQLKQYTSDDDSETEDTE